MTGIMGGKRWKRSAFIHIGERAPVDSKQTLCTPAGMSKQKIANPLRKSHGHKPIPGLISVPMEVLQSSLGEIVRDHMNGYGTLRTWIAWVFSLQTCENG